jgi:hypothetical protein
MCAFPRSLQEKKVREQSETNPSDFLPWRTHQKDEFSRQMDVFPAIVILNILPGLIEDQFGILNFCGANK